MSEANRKYVCLLKEILNNGDSVTTRNSQVYSHFDLPNITFTELPLITLRKTAWKKALREMEWFLSGNSKCPDELLDWWDGQLDKFNRYEGGYSTQFRAMSGAEETIFDQIDFIQEGLKNNPNSRRLLMTVWSPIDMAEITMLNDNPNTPTCCHSIVVQFFVRNGYLSMKTYQRSADMLLGVPHNWVQSWAMLMWFAHHAGLKVGSMTWMWGDAHVYDEESHIDTAHNMIRYCTGTTTKFDMVYTPTSKDFKASDFSIIGEIPEPVVTTRPKLL